MSEIPNEELHKAIEKSLNEIQKRIDDGCKHIRNAFLPRNLQGEGGEAHVFSKANEDCVLDTKHRVFEIKSPNSK